MKVAIITDTHYGSRKGSKLFHDYFENFYKNIFFPILEKENILTVIHMGDAFDSRKSIDYQSLEWSKRVVFDNLLKYDVHMIVGNHDVYYKNTNNVNSLNLLLKYYDNIKTYSSPTEIKLDNLDVLLLPWICSDNEEKSFKMIKKSKSKVIMGHLELQGFYANRGLLMDHGLDSKIFKNFLKVFSGHYHTRSNKDNVYYIGNPYEMYWTDYNDTRGFCIFDTETLEHYFIDNPYQMFHTIYYEDTPHQTFNASEFENKILKVIVKKKTKQSEFDKFIDKLYSSNAAEVKIIENFQIQPIDNFEELESEDTFFILNKYIQDSEINLDKSVVQNLIKEVYQEACEIM